MQVMMSCGAVLGECMVNAPCGCTRLQELFELGGTFAGKVLCTFPLALAGEISVC